jgi:hypothetical protein
MLRFLSLPDPIRTFDYRLGARASRSVQPRAGASHKSWVRLGVLTCRSGLSAFYHLADMPQRRDQCPYVTSGDKSGVIGSV